MKTIFLIEGYELEGSSDVLGVATTRAKADIMLAKAKRANARKEPMWRHESLVIGEYLVGARYLGKSFVVPKAKKPKAAKPKAAKPTKPKPLVIPIAPEFHRAVSVLTPAIPS